MDVIRVPSQAEVEASLRCGKVYQDHDARVVVEQSPSGPITVVLSDLGARRLMLALGVNTARYGPEIKALLDGLSKVLLGLPSAGFEQSHPHGPGCPCDYCEEAFRGD